MPDDEAQALLAELIAAATAPGFTWLHRWQAGDVVMWDNRAILHRGGPRRDDISGNFSRPRGQEVTAPASVYR